jgi:hypothetical protein
MVESYIITVEEHLMAIVSYQRNWNARLQSSSWIQGIHSRYYGLDPGENSYCPTTSITQSINQSLNERPAIDHLAKLVEDLHYSHYFADRHLKLASDRMKTRYDRLAEYAGTHEN